MRLGPEITRRIEEQKRLGGINVSILEPGTRIEVQTLNSLYKLEVLDDGLVRMQGGNYLPEPVEGEFKGSTWGTSLLKQHWIGKGMKMEFAHGEKILTTSIVEGAKVIGDLWMYEMWG